MSRKIGMWLYSNGGGDIIGQKIIEQLKQRDIEVYDDINLRYAKVENGHILCKETIVDELDLLFSYNAGQQTQYQIFLYQAINRIIPTINSFEAFQLTEDKFQTAFLLQQHGIPTADFKLCHRNDKHHLKNFIKQWDKMVYKPTDGWGGIGLTKIDNEATLDIIMPFLDQMNIRFFYVEKFIDYDNTDYRIDIVNGEFVGCYGRRARNGSWKTNITSGGEIFLREPNDKVVDLALKASKICGTDIAGVDIIYDRNKEDYIVLEVNGIPAFATPEQEELGLDFNKKKIDLIVNMIDEKTRKDR
jgi:ribosomal protein S6--L-glutamate ligase